MAAHLSAVPSGELGAVPGKTTTWPWHLTNHDVITIDPRTGDTGEWRVTSYDRADYDTTAVTCELPDGEGDAVLVYHGGEKATIRATAPRPAYTDQERDAALDAMSCGDRAYIAVYLRRYHREIFDQALQRITRRAAAHVAKETTP